MNKIFHLELKYAMCTPYLYAAHTTHMYTHVQNSLRRLCVELKLCTRGFLGTNSSHLGPAAGEQTIASRVGGGG